MQSEIEVMVLWAEWTPARKETVRTGPTAGEVVEYSARGSVHVLATESGVPVVLTYSCSQAAVTQYQQVARHNLKAVEKTPLLVDERDYTGKDGKPKKIRELVEEGAERRQRGNFSLDAFDDAVPTTPARAPASAQQNGAAPGNGQNPALAAAR